MCVVRGFTIGYLFLFTMPDGFGEALQKIGTQVQVLLWAQVAVTGCGKCPQSWALGSCPWGKEGGTQLVVPQQLSDSSFNAMCCVPQLLGE